MNTNTAAVSQATKARFCTKCGTKLPVNAAFCTRCGNKLPASAVQYAAVPQKARSGRLNPASIASRVCAAVAIIAMFMPWLEFSGMGAIGDYSSMLGISIPSGGSYSMLGMGSAARELDSLTGSDAFSGIHLVCLALWTIALVLVIIGLIRSFVGRKPNKSMLVGGIVAALVAIVWAAAVMFVDGEISRQVVQFIGGVHFFAVPAAVPMTAVMSIASGVLSVAGNKRA